MRIVSWNMGAGAVRQSHHDPAWHYLLDPAPALAADLALVQEAVLPGWLQENHQAHWQRAWPRKSWGTGIVTKRELRLEPLQKTVDGGRFVIARVAVDRGEVIVASIHAHTSLPEFMPPLEATIAAIREECSGFPFIIGGDLNTARAAEGFWPGFGHGPFWESLDAAGLHSCYWEEHGQEAITYRHPHGRFAGQADHVLVDAETAANSRITSSVGEESELSDHLPLIVDLEWGST